MKKILILCLLVIIIFVFCSCTKSYSKEEEYDLLVSNKLPIDTIYAYFVYDDSKLENIIGFFDYVFIGKIKDYKDTITDTPSGIPNTIYVLEVILNIKGTLLMNEDIELIKGGGLSEDYKRKYIYDDDILPKKDNYYIFLARASAEGDLYANGGSTTIKIENTENYYEDEEYIKCLEAYENENVYDRERYKSKYEQE